MSRGLSQSIDMHQLQSTLAVQSAASLYNTNLAMLDINNNRA